MSRKRRRKTQEQPSEVTVDEFIARVKDGLPAPWLSEQVKVFLRELKHGMMDAIPDNSLHNKFAHFHEACAVNTAPLVDEAACLKLLLWAEMRKPLDPEIPVTRWGESNEEFGRAVANVVATLAQEHNLPLPDDAVREAVEGAVMAWLKPLVSRERAKLRQQFEMEKAGCLDWKKVMELVKTSVAVVNTRTKIVSPLHDEQYAAAEMERSAFLTDVLWKHLSGKHLDLYHAIQQDLNSHWGRREVLTFTEEVEAYAREVGQLGPGETFEDAALLEASFEEVPYEQGQAEEIEEGEPFPAEGDTTEGDAAEAAEEEV